MENNDYTYTYNILACYIDFHPWIWVCLSASSEAIVKRAIEHIYPLVLPFSRSKLLEDVRLMSGENQALEQNTDVEESNVNQRM